MREDTGRTRTLYFEDLQEGVRFVSPGRTITETDLVNFAGVSGDFNQIHVDRVHAAGMGFGQPVVHGLLGLSIATGLIDRLGLFQDSMAAMLSVEDWTFSAPIFCGDTVHLRITIDDLRLTSQGDTGVVRRRMEVVNQDDIVCQHGTIVSLIRCRPATDDRADADGAVGSGKRVDHAER